MSSDPLMRHPPERRQSTRDSVRLYAVACCCLYQGPQWGALVGALLGGGLNRSADDPGFDPEGRIPGVHWLFDRLPRTQWLFWSSLCGVTAVVPLLVVLTDLLSRPASNLLFYPLLAAVFLVELAPLYVFLAWLVAWIRLKLRRTDAAAEPVPAQFGPSEPRALHRTLGGGLLGTLIGFQLEQATSSMQLFVETRATFLFRDPFHADWSIAYVCCLWCCLLGTLGGLLGAFAAGFIPRLLQRARLAFTSSSASASGLSPGWPATDRVFSSSLGWVLVASVPLIGLLAGFGPRTEPLLLVGDSLHAHQTRQFELLPTSPVDPKFLRHCPGCGNPKLDRFPGTAQILFLLLGPVQIVAAWMLARWRLNRRREQPASSEELRTVNRALGWSLLGMLAGIRLMQLVLSHFSPWR